MHRKGEIAFIAILFLLAFFIRINNIAELPPGMYGDEVSVARHALSLTSSPEIVPFMHDYSHPTPILYATALAIELFGKNITAIRMPSVLIGSFTVPLFYILLRLFFKPKQAVIGTLFFLFSYTHITLSRLAFEPVFSIFFQTLSLFFFFKARQEKNEKWLIGFGLSTGAGLYTYLNFRLFAVIILIFSIFLLKKGSDVSSLLRTFAILAATVFISSVGILSFAAVSPQSFWERSMEVSIFNQNLPLDEIAKELAASSLRSVGSLGFIGDPNPRHNPAGMPIIDVFTAALAIIGGFFLAKRQKSIIIAATLFMIPFFIGDILSLERIPEFHYYGIGHPHALRISGIIGPILLLATFGIFSLYSWILSKDKYMAKTAIVFIVGFISVLNFYIYFAQRAVSPNNYLYNYRFNETKRVKIGDTISKSAAGTVLVSSTLLEFEQTQFFSGNKKLVKFDPKTSEELIARINKGDSIVIDINDKTLAILNELDNKIKGQSVHFKIQTNPLGAQEAILFNL
jgi:4-amino-4-deoxy-L-arabinose transferase-like glycosyltransferase